MTIIRLDHDRLKICLTKEEMRDMDLDESRLDYRDPGTKGALVTLLQKARVEAGFHPRGAKVIVEILPDESDGCILCFTAIHGLRLSPGKTDIEPAVYAFASPFDLYDAMRGLYGHYGHRVYQSNLYAWQGEFRLVVRALDYQERQSARFLEEYARYIGAGEALAAYIDEHGELLLEDNAVDSMGKELERLGG